MLKKKIGKLFPKCWTCIFTGVISFKPIFGGSGQGGHKGQGTRDNFGYCQITRIIFMIGSEITNYRKIKPIINLCIMCFFLVKSTYMITAVKSKKNNCCHRNESNWILLNAACELYSFLSETCESSDSTKIIKTGLTTTDTGHQRLTCLVALHY